jgi:uncharacterized membrane protein
VRGVGEIKIYVILFREGICLLEFMWLHHVPAFPHKSRLYKNNNTNLLSDIHGVRSVFDYFYIIDVADHKVFL